MKRELEHFTIGSSYGGNQDWFRTFMMRLGGCGAETACDSSLYFAIHRGVKDIYPFELKYLSKHDYIDFAHMMEHYLWPRRTGINRLDIYTAGYSKYLRDRGVSCLSMDTLDGSEPYEKAEAAIMNQIDSGYPVPTLILNHRNKELKDYVWHWFLINGYDIADGFFRVKAVTYSGWQWLDLRKLWNTGFEEKGGLIIYKLKDEMCQHHSGSVSE